MPTTTELKIAVCGDIHLGHARTPTSLIINNLKQYFLNPVVLDGVKLLVFEGDVFENLLDLPDLCVGDIQEFAAYCVRLAAQMNIVFLVLEGTPLHDRKQSRIFVQQNERLREMGYKPAELYYVETLSILRVESLGLDILCVPDECNHTTQETQTQVDALLKSKGLTQVDYAVMHGCFRYQVPQISKDHIKFDEDFFLERVKYLIFIGHIHQASRYERILASGGYDRLCHGDEVVKGGLLCTVRPDGTWTARTIENKGAMTYKTVTCMDADLEDSFTRLQKAVKNLRLGSFVQIESEGKHPILQAQAAVQQRWPDFKWSFVNRQKPQKNVASIQQPKKYQPLIINRDTLQTLCRERLSRSQTDSAVMALALSKLEELM